MARKKGRRASALAALPAWPAGVPPCGCSFLFFPIAHRTLHCLSEDTHAEALIAAAPAAAAGAGGAAGGAALLGGRVATWREDGVGARRLERAASRVRCCMGRAALTGVRAGVRRGTRGAGVRQGGQVGRMASSCSRAVAAGHSQSGSSIRAVTAGQSAAGNHDAMGAVRHRATMHSGGQSRGRSLKERPPSPAQPCRGRGQSAGQCHAGCPQCGRRGGALQPAGCAGPAGWRPDRGPVA